MKRIALIIFIISYLIPAIGFSMDVHFCCDQVQSVKVDFQNNHCANHKGMSGRCCKDVHTLIKLSDTQNAGSQVGAPLNNFSKSVYNLSFTDAIVSQRVREYSFTNYHSQPFESKLPVYIIVSVFRV